MSALSAEQEAGCLCFNVFEGDFGEQGDRILSDDIVTARKPGPCHACGEMIEPGTRTRRLAAIFGGDMCGYRWCQPCCAAMALSWSDSGVTMEARVALRFREGVAP